MSVAMHRSFALIVSAWLLAWPTPSQAKSPRESMCNLVIELPDGKFSFKPVYGYSVIREVQRQGAAFTVKSEDKVVGFACLRSTLIPVPEDLVVLKAGYSMTIAEERNGGGMIYLEAAEGKVVAKSENADFSDKDQRAFDAAVMRMQAALDRGRTPQP
jgi:hypothetical protein